MHCGVLLFLANNSRLLILPDCHSPNLISRLMKLMLARLSADWLARWGHPLAMVETFVDPQLYQGTAYKVSGWSHLGQTAGWKRDASDFYLKHDAVKQIWVRELVKKAAVKLRAAQLPPEWAMVEAQARPRCTQRVKEIHSLMEALRRQLPEFRRPQALGYPVAGLVCLVVMAMATGVRKGPDDLADYADTLSQPQLRALLFRQDKRTGRPRCPKRTTFTRLLAAVDAAELGGKIVLCDALHTQVETSQLILYGKGADYLMTVKGNQPTLQRTLQDLFDKQVSPPTGQVAEAGAQTGAQPPSAGDSCDPVPGGARAQVNDNIFRVVPGNCLHGQGEANLDEALLRCVSVHRQGSNHNVVLIRVARITRRVLRCGEAKDSVLGDVLVSLQSLVDV